MKRILNIAAVPASLLLIGLVGGWFLLLFGVAGVAIWLVGLIEG